MSLSGGSGDVTNVATSQIKVVINRYAKTPEFELKQVGKVLDTEVYATISNDYQAAISSINVGEPLVLSKSQSRVVQDFGHLASRLSGVRSTSENSETPLRQKSGGWSSLFGSKR